MLSALIVDDEELARRLVREYLKKHLDINIVGESDNGLDAVEKINTLAPDLVFLDIQMPKLTGLEVLLETGRRTGVIFTTAYDEHAVRAFDLHAVDYLLKPFSQSRFDEALSKVRIQRKTTGQDIDRLVADTKMSRLLIKDRGDTHLVPIDKIEFVRAEDDYIHIHAAGKVWMKTQSLSELEKQLDVRKFVRVHRSYLINLEFLDKLQQPTKGNHVVVMRNGDVLPISRSGYERLTAAM